MHLLPPCYLYRIMLPPSSALKADIEQVSPAIYDHTSSLPMSDALPKVPVIPSAYRRITLLTYSICFIFVSSNEWELLEGRHCVFYSL